MPDSFRPVSPGFAGNKSQSYYFQLALYAGGNVLAVGICLLLWFCWDVLSAFQEPLVWSYLCSLSLRDIKRYLVNTARRELQASSFVVCCAKLVFLPAVIVWQLFEELQDKLQSKYHELQQKKQGIPAKAALGAAAESSRTSTDAALVSNNLVALLDDSKDSADSESEQLREQRASPVAGAKAPTALASNGTAADVVLQQRTHTKQQGLRQRKPPLVPKPEPTGKAASGRKQSSAASMSCAKAGKAIAASTAVGKPLAGKGAAAAAAAAKPAPHSRSKLQRRLRRYKHIAVRQLKWYWFCLVELLKFVLGGLWPQQHKPQQQQQPQQQQLLLTPAVSSRVGRLSSAASYSSPVAAAASGRLTAAGGFDPFASTPMCVSAAGSISSSSLSEHGTWTPQQQQQQRLSTSYSSPSLAMGAMLSQGSLQQQLQFHNTTAAAFHSISRDQQQQLQHHVSVDDSMLLSTSFGGWATAQQQQLSVSPLPFRHSGLPQPQQQCGLPSRTSSNGAASSSSTGSIKAAAAAAAITTMGSLPTSPDAAPVAAVAEGGVQGGCRDSISNASGAVTPTSRSLAPDASAISPPSRAYSASVSAAACTGEFDSTTAGAAAARFASVASSMSFGAGASGFGASPWEGFAAGGHEGLGLTSGAPTAPGSVIMGLGSSGSPSNILFKWLLRGIVLFEGWRYAQSFWDPDQPMFVLLLLVGGTLAVAFGLPVLLLPSSLLWRSTLHDTTEHVEQCNAGDADTGGASSSSNGGKAGSPGICSPFKEQQQQQGQQQSQSGNAVAEKKRGSSSSWPGQSFVQAAWSSLVELLVRADVALRTFCSSSFLDTAVSGLIVVGLILGSVVLSVVLLVQVGDESRQAVLHMNTLVRQKVDSEGALRQGVRSLLQEYEGQVTTMLRDSLPSVTQYVESRAVEFLVSHNLSKVLLDLETVKAALHLPGDCSEEAKIQLAVQLANSSLAVQDLGQQRQQLQQQSDAEQQVITSLAAQYEALQITSSEAAQGNTGRYDGRPGSTTGCQGPSSVPAETAAAAGAPATDSSNSNEVAQALLMSQQRLTAVRESLHGVEASYDAANEQLQLAQLRLHNCHPEATAAAEAAGHARGFNSFLTSFWPQAGPSAPTASMQNLNRSSGLTGPGAQLGHISHSASHVRRMLGALTKFDFGAASSEAAAALGHLFPHQQEHEEQQQQGGCSAVQPSAEQDERLGYSSDQQQQQQLAFPPAAVAVVDAQPAHVDNGQGCARESQQQQQQQLQCFYNWSSSSSSSGEDSSGNTSCSNRSSGNGTSAPAAAAAAAAAIPTGSSSGAAATGSIMRVAQGAAYPLITSMRTLSSVFFTGVGSTTAVALGTGLGVLRLGLGVMKFCVQLGVFASVLYTLLALDIDPVEQLVRLLPMSEASQDRASRAVTKAMRGVFVSSLKLAAFHAGFTWLTLRAFNTHFVCLATAASAVVAVLPLVPVSLVALPAVLELALLRGAPVKGFILGALHLGAYYFGDDLIFREVEPTLPYLVGLGVFGGMYTFKNPLQGVLLGPMVLALLSVGYNLHRALY